MPSHRLDVGHATWACRVAAVEAIQQTVQAGDIGIQPEEPGFLEPPVAPVWQAVYG
jgi:hypothetical protein